MSVTGIRFNNAILDTFLNLKAAESKAVVSAKAIKKIEGKRVSEKEADDLLDSRKKELAILENKIMRNNLLNNITFVAPESKEVFHSGVLAY